MADVLLVLVLACVVVAGVVAMRKRARQGSACCGEREEAPQRVRVTDRNKAHYPYVTTLAVGGMTCENCAIKVENALNVLPDTWATVSIDSHEARVLTKDAPNEATLRAAIREAGYVAL